MNEIRSHLICFCRQPLYMYYSTKRDVLVSIYGIGELLHCVKVHKTYDIH